MIKIGNLCGEKCQYPDGIGYTIWHPFPDDDEIGICFDFAAEQLEDLKRLLKELEEAPLIKRFLEIDNRI